eukprot:15411101-Alexandrium_andersonii.AAC.1
MPKCGSGACKWPPGPPTPCLDTSMQSLGPGVRAAASKWPWMLLAIVFTDGPSRTSTASNTSTSNTSIRN